MKSILITIIGNQKTRVTDHLKDAKERILKFRMLFYLCTILTRFLIKIVLSDPIILQEFYQNDINRMYGGS